VEGDRQRFWVIPTTEELTMSRKNTKKVEQPSTGYSPEFLEEMKSKLLEMRRELLREVSRAVKEEYDHSRHDVGDFYDHASQNRERELALTLSDREREKLFLINDALKRIEEGTYGYCEITGEKIGEERLRALPFTKLSVEAQEELERSKR